MLRSAWLFDALLIVPLSGLSVPQQPPKRVTAWAAQMPRQKLAPWSYELPSGRPPAGYIDLTITHCGLCHSDVHQIDDAWGAACFPLVPGHEIVGTIAAVGDDSYSHARFKVGDRAAIGVQRGSCGTCSCCRDGQEQVCPSITKTYSGAGQDKGGFAEMIRFPSAWTFPTPAGLPSEHLAPLMCAGATTYGALARYGARGGKVGIVGIGGLGHIALQMASHMGFSEVVAISRSESKREESLNFGASSFMCSEDEESMAMAAATFDCILNTASGHAPLDTFFGLLKPRGALVCVGLPSKAERSQLFLQSCVQSERQLVGSYLCPYSMYEEMLNFSAQHDIRPRVELFPIADVNEAIRKVRENTMRYRGVLVF